MSGAGALLRVAGVSRHFGGLQALSDVAFDVEAGSIHAIIGPNGAGKTTLFNVLSGVVAPSTGSIRFADTDITGWSAHRITRLGLARTFQNIQLFPQLTVRENVLVAHHACAQPGTRAAARATADGHLRTVLLDGKAHHLPTQLSYGDQRRTEIARALATEPACIMMDEPTAGMSGGEAQAVAQLMGALRDAGTTVLLIEHNMHVVMAIADRITVLNFGKLIAEGAPDEIRRDPAVIEAYLGSE